MKEAGEHFISRVEHFGQSEGESVSWVGKQVGGGVCLESLRICDSNSRTLLISQEANLFREIAGLIISEMMLAPELGRRGDQFLEAIWRFRFCRWSTHK